ncbi:MAG: hypothetical protein U1F46_11155 [Marinagarivorans sp.]
MRKIIDDCKVFWLSLDDKQTNINEAEEEFILIWQEALREVDNEDLTVDQARDAIEGAMADYLGCPVMTLRGDLQAMSEGVSRGGSVPKSVLTGQLPDLTVKPEKSDAKPNGQSTATRSGAGTSGSSESRQEAAKSSVQETATRNQEAARTITQEATESSHAYSAAGIGNADGGSQGESVDTESGLEDFDDITTGSSAAEIQEEILVTAERLASMYGFEELVVPGDHLAPGTDHFGYLMLPPTPEIEARFVDFCFNRGETAPSAIYRQLLNMSFACKFVFANSPDLKFFDYLTANNSPEACDMRLQGEGWLAAVRRIFR